MTGKEIYANTTNVAAEQVLFTINHRLDLFIALVEGYRGVLLMLPAHTFEGCKEDITLYCRLKELDAVLLY